MCLSSGHTEDDGAVRRLSLTAGELAVALVRAGADERAFAPVRSLYPVKDSKDGQLLVSASLHSLLARDLARQEGSGYTLSPPLEQVVRLLLDAERTFLCLAFTDTEGAVVAYHFSAAGVLQHTVRDGGINDLEVLSGPQQAALLAADFFPVPDAAAQRGPSIVLPQGVLQEIRESRDAAFIGQRLADTGVPENLARIFQEDLLRSHYRGSVGQTDHDDDEEDEGADGREGAYRFHLLAGETRLWLLVPIDGRYGPMMEIVPASKATLQEAFAIIMGPDESEDETQAGPGSDWDVI